MLAFLMGRTPDRIAGDLMRSGFGFVGAAQKALAHYQLLQSASPFRLFSYPVSHFHDMVAHGDRLKDKAKAEKTLDFLRLRMAEACFLIEYEDKGTRHADFPAFAREFDIECRRQESSFLEMAPVICRAPDALHQWVSFLIRDICRLPISADVSGAVTGFEPIFTQWIASNRRILVKHFSS